MLEQNDLVTFAGNPVTLVGGPVVENEAPPDVELVSNDMSMVKLSDFKGKICLISSVPSLDTPICDLQTRHFNQEATKIVNNLQVVTISVDLPFAQKRWCGASGLDNVITLSDHRDTSFGTTYGVLMKEFRLLTRAVFILDANGVLQYRLINGEVREALDYDSVLDKLKNMV